MTLILSRVQCDTSSMKNTRFCKYLLYRIYCILRNNIVGFQIGSSLIVPHVFEIDQYSERSIHYYSIHYYAMLENDSYIMSHQYR